MAETESVVSSSSSGSISVKSKSLSSIKNEKTIKSTKKKAEVGRRGRKCLRKSTSNTTPSIPCSTPHVVSNLQYSRRSPHYTTPVAHTRITPYTDAGLSCGTTDDPIEAAYGLPQCRSASVIVSVENRSQ